MAILSWVPRSFASEVSISVHSSIIKAFAVSGALMDHSGSTLLFARPKMGFREKSEDWFLSLHAPLPPSLQISPIIFHASLLFH